MSTRITAKRIKPKGNYCSSCLKNRKGIQRLFELHFINLNKVGEQIIDYKIYICDLCMKDIQDLVDAAYNSKGEDFTREVEHTKGE